MLLTVGVVFILGPLWGTLGSVASVAGAFDRGTRSAEAALNISVSLWTTVIGWVMTPIGVVMVCIALVRIFKGGSETSSSS